jgi:hypothetical protein
MARQLGDAWLMRAEATVKEQRAAASKIMTNAIAIATHFLTGTDTSFLLSMHSTIF